MPTMVSGCWYGRCIKVQTSVYMACIAYIGDNGQGQSQTMSYFAVFNVSADIYDANPIPSGWFHSRSHINYTEGCMRGYRKFCQRGSKFDNGVLWWDRGSKYHYKWWPNVAAGLVALWFFRGSGPVLLRNPIFLWIFRGGGSGPSRVSLHRPPIQ